MKKSNCVIEAVKAKIRNPIEVKLHVLHTSKIPFHLMWEYNGKEYGFEGYGEEPDKLYPFIYTGEITERPYGWIKKVRAASIAVERAIKSKT